MSKDKITQKISQLAPEQSKQLQKIIKKTTTSFKKNKYSSPLSYANKRNEVDEVPLSFSQERQWFFEQLNPNSCAYNIHRSVKLTGKLNILALEKALQTIVERHETLRTIFIAKNGIPITQILDNVIFKLTTIDLQKNDDNEKEELLNKYFNQELKKPFNLTKDLMFRANLYCLSDREYILLISLHHIVGDGWSLGVLNKEISQLYNAYCENQPSPLPDLPLQYGDYSLWQKDYFNQQKLEELLSYWRDQFQGEIPVLNLPTDNPRPSIESFNGAKYPVVISNELTTKLKQLARKLNITLFTVLLTTFKILLYRYTGDTKIIICSPIASRNYLEIENLIGFFVNTLALKTDLSNNQTFAELLTKVKTTTQKAYIHQELPYEKLIEALNIQRDLSRSPVTPIVFSFQNVPDKPLNLQGLNISSYGIHKDRKKDNLSLNSFLNNPDNGISRCDLALFLREEDGEIGGVLEYNTDLFNQDTIARFIEHLRMLLESIVDNPQEKISRLNILTSQEKQQILIDWNNTKVDYPKEKCIHQLFEEQVVKTPEHVAVVFEREKLTYQQLNEKANQLAHYLIKQGVKVETKVGICVDRSLDMIIGILAILKAGGCYVPIDPNYPQKRINYILEDTSINILLTQKRLTSKLSKQLSPIYVEEENKWNNESKKNIKYLVRSHNLAYIIYTSGSTGKPKGVVIQHKSVCNHMIWRQKQYLFTHEDRVLQKASLSFDLSVAEIFIALISGAILYIHNLNNLEDLVNLIVEEKITTVCLLPSLLNLMLNQGYLRQCTSINKIFVGGEKLSVNVLQTLQKQIDFPFTFSNMYGPTETCISSIFWKIN